MSWNKQPKKGDVGIKFSAATPVDLDAIAAADEAAWIAEQEAVVLYRWITFGG